MIKDTDDIMLNPTNLGKNCLGNGKHYDKNGNLIPICCDECDFYICCIDINTNCNICTNEKCTIKISINTKPNV